MKDKHRVTQEIFANSILYYRKACGLSQEELAEKVHLSNNTISKIETGKSFPKPDKIYEFAEVFGITLDKLFQTDSQRKLSMIPFIQTLDAVQNDFNESINRAKGILQSQEYSISHTADRRRQKKDEKTKKNPKSRK